MMQTIRIMNTSSLMTGVTGLCDSFIPNSVYTQCIRWKRKPIWLPTAKSKVFRVPKRPVIPIEEKVEIQRLYNNYRTYMTSLRSYLYRIAKENKVEFDIKAFKQTEEEDFHACNAINDQWNANLAKEREIKLAKRRERREAKILRILMQQEKQKKNERERIDEHIRKVKEELSIIITADNVDAAIEECLANVVNHNRAVDPEGNWYDGKYLPILPVEDSLQKPVVVEQRV